MDKNTIIKESFTMFRQYGVKSVSMDDIAHRLSISKKTLYTHFENKEDLLLIGIRKIFKRLFEEYEQIISENHHPLITLSLYYYAVLLEISRYESAYFYSVNKYSVAISSEIEKQRNKIIEDIVVPLLNKANELECLSDDINIELFIELHLRLIEDRYTHAVNLMPKLPMIHIYKHLIVYPIIGICNPKYSKRLMTELEELRN